jgi:RimJ/RimL family protein N-acetyltransferase
MSKHFKTNSVIVRRFQMKDAKQAYENLSNSFKTNDNTDSFLENERGTVERIEKIKMEIKSAINEYYTDEPIWAVEDKENKNLVGGVRVCNYSSKNKMCNISWMMFYKYWNNSFMKDALTQVLKFLFTKKDIELIECSYYEQNENNSVILDEIGMRKEAVLRDRRFNEKTNKRENFVIYSINRKEFLEKVKNDILEHNCYKKLSRKI